MVATGHCSRTFSETLWVETGQKPLYLTIVVCSFFYGMSFHFDLIRGWHCLNSIFVVIVAEYSGGKKDKYSLKIPLSLELMLVLHVGQFFSDLDEYSFCLLPATSSTSRQAISIAAHVLLMPVVKHKETGRHYRSAGVQQCVILLWILRATEKDSINVKWFHYKLAHENRRWNCVPLDWGCFSKT